MKIVLLQNGKTKDPAVISIAQEYYKRIGKYVPFEEKTIPDLKNTKNLTQQQVKLTEAEKILKEIQPDDLVALLDENGKEYSSLKFANYLQSLMNRGPKRIIFVIGGAYGFADQVYRRADVKISLSRMTFSHQIIRAIFAEQLYRAFSILNNEPYHHQ